MRHPKSEVLSEYLDNELTQAQSSALEAHLDECPRCASLFQDLKEIQSRARDLPDRYPENDLWPEISRAMASGATGDAEVIRLHPGLEPAEAGRRRWERGVRVSYLQAAAAVLAVALFSGLSGAYFSTWRTDGPPGAGPVSAGWVEAVGSADSNLDSAAREVARLESLLNSQSGDLDPVTARLLEKNLEVINQAIRESLQALEADPGNPFLESHLAEAVQAKANYLREATAFVAPAG